MSVVGQQEGVVNAEGRREVLSQDTRMKTPSVREFVDGHTHKYCGYNGGHRVPTVNQPRLRHALSVPSALPCAAEHPLLHFARQCLGPTFPADQGWPPQYGSEPHKVVQLRDVKGRYVV